MFRFIAVKVGQGASASPRGPHPAAASIRLAISLATVLPRPPQHIQMPAANGAEHVLQFHSQSLSIAHLNTSGVRPKRHVRNVPSLHGQPCSRARLSRARLSASRCLPRAGVSHVAANCHGQLFATAQTNIDRDSRPNGAIPTGGSSALQPTRGRPELTTAVRTNSPCARAARGGRGPGARTPPSEEIGATSTARPARWRGAPASSARWGRESAPSTARGARWRGAPTLSARRRGGGNASSTARPARRTGAPTLSVMWGRKILRAPPDMPGGGVQ